MQNKFEQSKLKVGTTCSLNELVSPFLTLTRILGGIRPGGYLTPLWTTQLVGKSGKYKTFIKLRYPPKPWHSSVQFSSAVSSMKLLVVRMQKQGATDYFLKSSLTRMFNKHQISMNKYSTPTSDFMDMIFWVFHKFCWLFRSSSQGIWRTL